MAGMSTTMKQLRKMYEAYYDSYDNKRPHPVFAEKQDKEMDTHRIDLIETMLSIILDTDMVDKVTKAYIRSDLSYKQLKDRLGVDDEHIKNMTQGTFNQIITRYTTKINNTFGKDTLTVLRFYPDRDISNIESKIDNAHIKYCNALGRLRDDMLVKVSSKPIVKSFDDSCGDFCTLYKTALELTVGKVQRETDRLNNDSEAVGYLNFLLSGLATTDERVLRDREYIYDIIKGNPLKTVYGKGENAIYPYGKDIDNFDEKDTTSYENEDTSEVKEDEPLEISQAETVVEATLDDDDDI